MSPSDIAGLAVEFSAWQVRTFFRDVVDWKSSARSLSRTAALATHFRFLCLR
jgi:hypothetical protein